MGEMLVDGRKASWRAAGAQAAGAPVLFAHCSLARSAVWKPMMEALEGERPTLAPDMPAHGRTDGPAAGVSLQRHAVAIFAALAEAEKARTGRRVHLVGHSLGAAVLGRLAAERPDLIASVALAEPIWFHLLRPLGHVAAAEDEEKSIGDVRARREAAAGPGEEVRAFMNRWGVPGAFDKMPPEAQAGAVATFQQLSADFDWVIDWPEGQIGVEALRAMQVPTLIFCGDESPLPAVAVTEALAKTIPGARRHVIRGAGHLAPLTDWQEALEELRGFWAAVDAQVEPV